MFFANLAVFTPIKLGSMAKPIDFKHYFLLNSQFTHLSDCLDTYCCFLILRVGKGLYKGQTDEVQMKYIDLDLVLDFCVINHCFDNPPSG